MNEKYVKLLKLEIKAGKLWNAIISGGGCSGLWTIGCGNASSHVFQTLIIDATLEHVPLSVSPDNLLDATEVLLMNIEHAKVKILQLN